MTRRRLVFQITLIVGFISTVCLVSSFLALTDIWHTLGSPDFWHGEGANSLEWRILGYAYWPMLVFHILFLVSAALARGDELGRQS